MTTEPVAPAPAPDPAPTPAPAPAPVPAPAPAPIEAPNSGDVEADLRAEAANYRIRAREANETAEQFRGRVEKAKSKMIDGAIRQALTAQGIIDPDLAGYVKRDGIAITEDFDVTGVDAAVTALKQAKPQFFRAASGPQPPPRPAPTPAEIVPPPAPGGPAPASVRDMSGEQYEKFKRERPSRIRQFGGR